MKCLKISLAAFLISISLHIPAQQNLTMYFVHSNPEVNSLNPAFQNTCKLFIGLPVLSSLHTNFNNAFSYREIFTSEGSNYYVSSSNFNLANVSSVNGEIYTNLFALGFWKKDNYITFSVIEKVDFAAFYHRELFELLVDGNTRFEGEDAKLKRTGAFLDYRREYALGLARKINTETTLGIKGKLLFGKINASTRKSDSHLYTDPNTFALTAHSKVQFNTSAPAEVTTNSFGRVTDINYTGNPADILLNRSNIGLAFDFGFIHKLDNQATISGSILDLGGIYYTSSPNNYTAEGDYTYNGQTTTTNSFRNIIDSAFAAFNTTLNNSSYMAFLPPRVYFNYEYNITPKTNLNALVSAKIYRYKIIPAYTVGASHQLIKNIYLAASWSYLNRTLKNIGTGLVLGHHPVQFYAFTDNILTAFDPLSSRNLNLRFGINLIFGCKNREKNEKSDGGGGGNYYTGRETNKPVSRKNNKYAGRESNKNCGCEGMDKAEKKQTRLDKLRKK